MYAECQKVIHNIINFDQVLDPCRTLWPPKILKQYIICKCSEWTNRLQKLIIAENLFISYVGGIKMYKKVPIIHNNG